MGLIKIKAKVKLMDEGDFEWDEESMGKVSKSSEWVWKDKVIDTYYIYDLTELTPARTIITFSDGKLLLVKDNITNLYNIWNKDYEVKEGYDDDDIDTSGIILPGEGDDDI